MRRSIRSLFMIGFTTWIAACGAQQPSESESAEERDGPMSVMRRRLATLEVVGADDQSSFSRAPILRYNDTPRGISDASVWPLGDTGRPRAVMVLEIYSRRSIQYEVTAVADPPEQLKGNRWMWSPKQAELTWLEVPSEAAPPATETVRKRQIKQLPRDFAASEETRGQRYQLRLMPQPLDVYEDRQQNVLDGAVFAWAHGTNVEILMFVEARQVDDGPPRWFAGFSRLGSASLEVTYQNEAFWRGPPMLRPRPDDAYYFRVESLTADERALLASE